MNEFLQILTLAAEISAGCALSSFHTTAENRFYVAVLESVFENVLIPVAETLKYT
jgi:hypothetical protein